LFCRPQRIVAPGSIMGLPAYGVRVALDAETGVEVDALDMHALVLDDARGEQRIESSGYQCNGFAWNIHDTGAIETNCVPGDCRAAGLRADSPGAKKALQQSAW